MAAGIVLLLALDRLPLFYHAIRVTHSALAENMRMPANKFCRHVRQDLANIEPAFFLGDLRMHYGKQNKVTELFAQILIITRADGARDFVRLLDQARKQRLISLLAVPRTAIGRAELGDDIA